MANKKPPHRPTIFTKKLALKICNRIANGESLRKICKDTNMPARKTVYLWLLDERKSDFLHQYNTSMNVRTEELFDELNEIADDGSNDYMTREGRDGETIEVLNSEHVQRSRLRIDTRKWYLSKVMPKKFGDKIDMTSGGEKLQQFTTEQLDEIFNRRNKSSDTGSKG